MSEGLDFSWSRPGSAAIKAAGRSFVCRYVGPSRFGGKGMTVAEMNDYLNNGIAVVLNFESSGQNTTSYANGAADATFAQAQAVLLGQPNAVIYFSNDKQDTTGLVDYLHGVASVIGVNRTGVYGGIGAIQVAQAAGAARWFWQTYAWSGGKVAPGVHIYQYLNGQTINGASVDFDRSLQSNFGQIGTGTPTDVNVQPFPATTPVEEDDMLALRIHNGNNTVYCATLGRGVFRHLIGTDNPEKVKNIIRSADDWQDISIQELPVYLWTYGCDLNIWDVRNGDFAIFNPLDGSVKAGGMWSAENAVRAAIKNIPQGTVNTSDLAKQITADFVARLAGATAP